jgi:CrcB protein
MHEIVLALVVFLGAGIGGTLRHVANRLLPLLLPGAFPMTTFIVNILGCFVMGVIAAAFALRGADASQTWRLFLTTGILGGFTTFSAFSLEFAVIWERGEPAMAVLYAGLTLVLTLVGVFAGMVVTRAFAS